jgi:AcrR family transcriptional regulator
MEQSTTEPTNRSADQAKKPKRKRVPRAEREPQMLDAATEVFSERGFHAASMEEIAARVQVTKPMLYAYFGSKEGLYRATVERAGNHLVRLVEGLMEERDAEQRLSAGADALLDFVFAQRASWAVVYNEQLGTDGLVDITAFRERVSDFIARTCVEIARQRNADGEAAVTEFEIASAWPYAIAMIGSCESLLRWWSKNEPIDEGACRRLCHELVHAHLDCYLSARGRAESPTAAR